MNAIILYKYDCLVKNKTENAEIYCKTGTTEIVTF